MFFILCIMIFEVDNNYFNSSKQSYVKCSFIEKLSFRNVNTHAIMRNSLLKKIKKSEERASMKKLLT